MSLVLCIETSTQVCSVALVADGLVLACQETTEPNAHSSKLTLFIQDLFTQTKHTISSIDAFAVSSGPGSYTGLRIGVSTAKGLAYAGDKPIISIPTLFGMTGGVVNEKQYEEYDFFIPMIDARRMEVYSQVYNAQGTHVRGIQADILTDDCYLEYLNTGKVLFFGDGALKAKTVIRHPNAYFDTKLLPSARYMAQIAHDKFLLKEFENLAYFEPFYLKDFIALMPTKHIYG